MGYESKRTKDPGMVEDEELDAVSIHAINTQERANKCLAADCRKGAGNPNL